MSVSDQLRPLWGQGSFFVFLIYPRGLGFAAEQGRIFNGQ